MPSIPENYPIPTYHQHPSSPLFFPFWYHVPHHHHRHSSYPQTNPFLKNIYIYKKKIITEEERRKGENGNPGRALRLPEFGHCTGGIAFARSVESFIIWPSPPPPSYSITLCLSTIWYSSYDIIHRAKTTPEKFAEQKEKKGKKRKEFARHVYDPCLRLTEWIDSAKKRSKN